MADKDVREVTENAVKRGGVLTKLYFDMQSEKQDELQPLMADLINNRLLKSPGVIYCFGTIDDPIKIKDVYSTNAMITVLFKDIGALINVVFNFSPIGIDIMKPEGQYTMKISELQSVMLSLSQISAEYSKYILSKVMSGEDLEKVKRDVAARAEQGKRLVEKKSSGEAPKEESFKN